MIVCEGTVLTGFCDVRRADVGVVSAVLASLNETHSVSNMKERTAIAPMSNER